MGSLRACMLCVLYCVFKPVQGSAIPHCSKTTARFQSSKHKLKCLGYLQYKCPLPEISFMWEGANEL